MADSDEASILALLDGLEEQLAPPSEERPAGEAPASGAAESDEGDSGSEQSTITSVSALERPQDHAIVEEHTRLRLQSRKTSSSDVNVGQKRHAAHTLACKRLCSRALLVSSGHACGQAVLHHPAAGVHADCGEADAQRACFCHVLMCGHAQNEEIALAGVLATKVEKTSSRGGEV